MRVQRGELEIIRRAISHDSRTAIVAGGRTTTYADLLERSASLASVLLGAEADLSERRVLLLAPPGPEFVVSQWAIWSSGGVVVPVTAAQTPAEWKYTIEDSGASIAVLSPGCPEASDVARTSGLRVVDPGARQDVRRALPPVARDRRAMILYTSGTTSSPKGAVLTHGNIEAETTCLVEAWRWDQSDRILHVLPLNHTHGLINALACALWSGACCDMLPRFDAVQVWERISEVGITLFMAVPTIYHRLVRAWEDADTMTRRQWTEGAARLRLMVSGSAALPVRLLARWRELTGHVLLERYGMTEIGMALSNPLDGERRAGRVGVPLPGVSVRLCDESGVEVPAGQPGEILVKGPGVFLEYHGRGEESRAAFTDGWFRTGDIATVENGTYRILGRKSVDIIKTGGYKVSALEIEEVIREHPAVSDCAVVGLDDPEWGEVVTAAIVPRLGHSVPADEFRVWARARMAGYKVPGRIEMVADLPRNAMGKVSKPAVKRLLGGPRP